MNDLLLETSDEMLMARYKRGDTSAFAELAQRYHHRVFCFIYWYLGSDAQATTLTKQTLLHIVRHAGQFRHESRFSTWLFSIARNFCQISTENSLPSQCSEQNAHTDHSVEQSNESQSVRAEWSIDPLNGLNALSSAERDVFLLRQVGEVSYHEIAQLSGKTSDEVNQLMKTALERLNLSRKQQSDEKGTLTT